MLAARSNKRMGTEKVKKEEVVQRSQLDNKSPIQVPLPNCPRVVKRDQFA